MATYTTTYGERLDELVRRFYTIPDNAAFTDFAYRNANNWNGESIFYTNEVLFFPDDGEPINRTYESNTELDNLRRVTVTPPILGEVRNETTDGETGLFINYQSNSAVMQAIRNRLLTYKGTRWLLEDYGVLLPRELGIVPQVTSLPRMRTIVMEELDKDSDWYTVRNVTVSGSSDFGADISVNVGDVYINVFFNDVEG